MLLRQDNNTSTNEETTTSSETGTSTDSTEAAIDSTEIAAADTTFDVDTIFTSGTFEITGGGGNLTTHSSRRN